MKSVYNNSLWRLPRVFHVGQGKWLALFPKLSGRYSTTLHCTHSTWLWVQACGLDLGEWAHPIYIQAITNRSERHMHAHNCIDCLSRQQCYPAQTKERKKSRDRENPQTQRKSTPTTGCSLYANSHRVSDPGSSCMALTHFAPSPHCQKGPWQASRLQTSLPPSPLLMQLKPGAECSCKGLQRIRMKVIRRQLACTKR